MRLQPIMLASALALAGCTSSGPGGPFDPPSVTQTLPVLPLGLTDGSRFTLISGGTGTRLSFTVRARDGRWVGVERNVFPLNVENGTISFDTGIKAPGKRRSLAMRLLSNGRTEVLAGSVRQWTWTRG